MQMNSKKIYDYIANYQKNAQGGWLTDKRLHHYIEERMSLTYDHNTVYKILRKLGFSWISSRSKHPKYDEEEKVVDLKK
ncbi:MAG: transposase [Psychromonas sp.]|jgi:transposase